MQAEKTPTGLRKCIELLEKLCEYNQETIYEALNAVIQNQNADRLVDAMRTLVSEIELEEKENREDWLRDVRMENL
jgi:hypothetical protein|nr:MAG TPA: hypothetical protein [Caudoviricetes sp.]